MVTFGPIVTLMMSFMENMFPEIELLEMVLPLPIVMLPLIDPWNELVGINELLAITKSTMEQPVASPLSAEGIELFPTNIVKLRHVINPNG